MKYEEQLRDEAVIEYIRMRLEGADIGFQESEVCDQDYLLFVRLRSSVSAEGNYIHYATLPTAGDKEELQRQLDASRLKSPWNTIFPSQDTNFIWTLFETKGILNFLI